MVGNIIGEQKVVVWILFYWCEPASAKNHHSPKTILSLIINPMEMKVKIDLVEIRSFVK